MSEEERYKELYSKIEEFMKDYEPKQVIIPLGEGAWKLIDEAMKKEIEKWNKK